MNMPLPKADDAMPPRSAQKFIYASGSRPLAGYTIQRGLGRGGFGEVYYAVSDAGKDVALKLVRRNLDVELRGVGQCLNFKYPHLLTLYDVKQDVEENTWIVMELIAGESLEQRLARSPGGLPPEEACQWIRGAAAGLAYLHEHGIVHRDLKPGNIFADEGIVKLGDYGLSKFISCSRRSGHTESVGTVHYMAPEVANGRYGKPIDIYALGVLLYETLTGRVPFEGESVGEVLMKHLTALPDLTPLAEPYRAVVGRALAKDPNERFESVDDMTDRLPSFPGSRLLFRPQGASAPAPPATAAPGGTGPRERDPRANVPPLAAAAAKDIRAARAAGPHAGPAERPGRRAKTTPALVLKAPRERLAELLGSMLLAAAAAAVIAVPLLLLRGAAPRPEQFAWLWIVSTLGAWSVMIPAKRWEGTRGDATLRRFAMLAIGLALGAAAWGLHGALLVDLTPDGPLGLEARPSNVSLLIFFAADGTPLVWAFVAYFGLLLGVMRWWRQADPLRGQRVSVGATALAVLAAWLINLFCPFPQPWGMMTAAAISLATQLASPSAE